MVRLPAVIFFLFVCIVSCKQDEEVCENNREVYREGHLVDISPLKRYPEFLDTLAKYPNLQVHEIMEDEYGIRMHCNVSKNNLLVFWGYYTLVRGKKFDKSLYESGTKSIADFVTITTPKISGNEAVSVAKNELDFHGTCPFYQLGYYYEPNEKDSMELYLVWRVQTSSGTPTVILDAQTGKVYYKDDGMRY